MREITPNMAKRFRAMRRARELREGLNARREHALRLPPLPGGHRDPNAPRTDAPDKAWGGARRG